MSDVSAAPEAAAPLEGGIAALDLDRVSLAQALRDFEVANGRVVDLTQRVISLTKQLQATQSEVEVLRSEARAARAEVEAILASKAYRAVQQLGVLRSLARR